MNGVIIVDKPAGFTSHDVVARMRRILGERSIGHLGTLDPLATGVLPLVTGSFTRLAQFYNASEKTYDGVIRFGFATDTYDADGEPVGEVLPAAPTIEQLRKLAEKFLGVTQQVPPPFSAKKINGVPAYKMARKRQEVVLKSAEVEIKELEIVSVEGDRAGFRARVASGTYIRSVAHEMGKLLGCGAHLESLRRTAVAEFDIARAYTLGEIEHCANNDLHDRNGAFGKGKTRGTELMDVTNINELFIHPRQLLPQFPSVTADEFTAVRISTGRSVNLPELSRSRLIKVFVDQRNLIAIVTRVAGTLFQPKIVFATPRAAVSAGQGSVILYDAEK